VGKREALDGTEKGRGGKSTRESRRLREAQEVVKLSFSREGAHILSSFGADFSRG